MSQKDGTPTKELENRPPNTTNTLKAPPGFAPLMPVFLPFADPNRPMQQFYVPPMYSSMQPYLYTAPPSVHSNFGLNFNQYPTPMYRSPQNLMSSTMYAHPMPPLMGSRPFHPSVLQSLPTSASPWSNGWEPNKNLNIRESQSPVTEPTTQTSKESPLVLQPKENDVEARLDASPSPSPPTVAQSEPDSTPEDFLTFIEAKSTNKAASIPMPELNPFANEFRFDKPSPQPAAVQPSEKSQDQALKTADQERPSHGALLDTLLAKSLESIQAWKESKKKTPTQDASVQCKEICDRMHRSTQTIHHRNDADLIEDYSLRGIDLMDQLLETFNGVYQSDFHQEFQAMAHLCDELRQLIVFIHFIGASAAPKQKSLPDIDSKDLFQCRIDELANRMRKTRLYTPPTQMPLGIGRGSRKVVPPMPSFSSRTMDFNNNNKAPIKLCLWCNKPVDEQSGEMHPSCQSLFS